MFCFVSDSVSCSPDWPGTLCVYVDALEFLILVPSPSQCWYYECGSPHLLYAVPGVKLTVPCVLRERSAAETQFQAPCRHAFYGTASSPPATLMFGWEQALRVELYRGLWEME